MSFTTLTVTTKAEHISGLSDILTLCGAESISLTPADNAVGYQYAPGETVVWATTALQALFLTDSAAHAAQTLLEKQYADHIVSSIDITQLPDKDWIRETQQQWQRLSFPTGRDNNALSIYPAWDIPSIPTDPYLVLDPGLAFGTGTHPTTELCLAWLAQHPLTQQTVIDYGCGSGILAMAALAVGAERVWAIDHDPQALEATANNQQHNTHLATERLTIASDKNVQIPTSDVILANILAQPLIELAPRFSKLLTPGGTVIISGILDTDIKQVCHAYPTFKISNTTIKDHWACCELRQVK